ncbi:MAG: hypothetical protein IJA91_03695 [Clostridia bacterium]|nr:hypothetical protein [Clostridia bacterium]
MRVYTLNNMTLTVDFLAGHISSLILNGKERIASTTPLFRLRLRDRDGQTVHYSVLDAATCQETQTGAIYTNFPAPHEGLTVQIFLAEEEGGAAWRMSVNPENRDVFVEWVDFPRLTLPALVEENTDGNGGEILLPYNEGVLVSNNTTRAGTDFRFWDPEYPSIGCYSLFPNMVSSQMMAYIWEDAGLYLGAHDPRRGVKAIDFFGDSTGTTMQMRLFCGVDFGREFDMAYPIVWTATEGRWEAAADLYRAWFETCLPSGVTKIRDNGHLPAWYEDSPLVISYPIRGIHDTDDMAPNALYPYTNALPLLDEIRRATDSRLLVLLMHWEGTAPWAPPYVWPPFGGVDNFNRFKDALHEKGDLLGVYCSGFGYTVQSRLVDDYDCSAEYEKRGLERGMCVGPDGTVAISKICTAQRSGYDVCPASPVGRDLLTEAYTPLFKSGVDYAQILDQNHGGGQYFCYSRDHGHPPAPGSWMTATMQNMLTEWNSLAPGMLFGCESAAAEPFIGNLLFSDNRFELNYMIGHPVPLYAYLYHEYLRNFMGNQVCSNIPEEEDSLPYRLAYSFTAGDCMTLVLTPVGELMDHWGTRDFVNRPHKETALRFIANLTRFYREEAKPYLYAGRMIPALPIDCDRVFFTCRYSDHTLTLPAVLTSAWELPDGTRAQILVNPSCSAVTCTVNGQELRVGALDAVILKLP